MNRGSLRREMLDLPPASVADAEIADFAITAAKTANLTFTGALLDSKFATTARIARSRGAAMGNRVRMRGAPGAIVAGNTVVIGADTYEFRGNAQPPAPGGTAGRIWINSGADSAASRANFVDAVNGVVRAADIWRTAQDATLATNTELVTATQVGQALGDVRVYTSTTIGSGVAAASGTATATTETLATGTDIWDQATMYGGVAEGVGAIGHVAITITAQMVTKGSVEAQFPFTPVAACVVDRSRPHDEVATILAGNMVSVTLTGGVSPNIQAADVIDIVAFS